MRYLAGLSSIGVTAAGARYSCTVIVVIGVLYMGACGVLWALDRKRVYHA